MNKCFKKFFECFKCSHEMVIIILIYPQWLLDEACADEKIRTGSGAVPLFFAVVGGDLNCVKLLMDENPRLG